MEWPRAGQEHFFPALEAAKSVPRGFQEPICSYQAAKLQSEAIFCRCWRPKGSPGTSKIKEFCKTSSNFCGFAVFSSSRLRDLILDPPGLRFGSLLAFKMPPRPSQERPRQAQERPRSFQDPPKSAQDTFKTAQRAPKMTPDRPKSAQDASKTSQEASKTTPRAPKRPPRPPQERPYCCLAAFQIAKSKHTPLSQSFLPTKVCGGTREASYN